MNVCNDVQLPGREKPNRQFLTPEQAQLLLQKVQGHPLEGIVTLALATGMREGEILGLRWSDVDLDLGMLRVNCTVTYVTGHGCVEGEPKTETSKRGVMLPPMVVDVLKRHRLKQLEKRIAAGAAWVDRDLVFPGDHGDFLISDTLLRRFHRLLEQIGLPRIRFHDLRHSAATLLLSMGVQMKVIQELLGHSSINITADIYSHVLPPTHREAIDKMGKFLDNSFDKA
jgi:integrase